MFNKQDIQKLTSRTHGKPVLHLGYAFQASSCMMRASAGAKVVSQVGALLDNKMYE